MRRSRSQHKQLGAPQVTPFEREYKGSRRDPEGRTATTRKEIREKMLDKTLADSFPTSDPPSTIPDPCAADSMGADVKDDRAYRGRRAA